MTTLKADRTRPAAPGICDSSIGARMSAENYCKRALTGGAGSCSFARWCGS